MTLYFDNGCTIREIASVSSEKEAYKIMNKFCEERGFKIYYVRQWTREDGKLSGKYTIFDVGSHTEFFYMQ